MKSPVCVELSQVCGPRNYHSIDVYESSYSANLHQFASFYINYKSLEQFFMGIGVKGGVESWKAFVSQ